MRKKNYARVLTIAGSDSGGGAGIQADLKTFSANQCYGMSVICALTAQNTVGVKGIHAVPLDFVREQIDAVLSDIGADAVKIGMLYSAGLVEAVSEELRRFKVKNIVLDPVMIAQSGDALVQEDAIDALKELLVPMAEIITPNIPETAALLGKKVERPEQVNHNLAPEICRLGCQHVLVKGGHSSGTTSDDILYCCDSGRQIEFPAPRVNTNNNHGTGCTLSSAIAAHIARGANVIDAVGKAKEYITGALIAGASYQLGQGHGPVHHFYAQFQD
ncbi:MAG: bifunctional hydroxymethylpyrimidine kinase/phosphomethylpyrimidine kinase [Desulfobulbus propionicus]|nr:MAG: bifunctional hydroxymethylpyrimidine kinase/phosphomethylpyrimidine kinase [Desulfobulbus propionicus]